jgi:APA family basic amino acid/polyamine antiporter
VIVLERRIGVRGAVVIGLSSMVGAGLFYVWAPAAAVAGPWLLVGLAIAAAVATLNALSSAQLAMAYPVSGGAYSFGRAALGPWWGFSAGWLFLAGKTASAAAIALIAAGYLLPEYARVLAVVFIATLAIVNASGIRSTARISATIVFVVLIGLGAILAVAALGSGLGTGLRASAAPFSAVSGNGWYGTLQSAGLLFFAFAGYARMATLGEEVRNPRRSLPIAIGVALGIALLVYGTVAAMLVGTLGIDRLVVTASPILELVNGLGGGTGLGWATLVQLLAALACLGSLVGILAGLSRTSLAMARGGDLPGYLGRISPTRSSPIAAEATMASLAMLGVLLLDATQLVGFSACAVLVYYAIANLAALRQPAAGRWLPRWVQILGLIGCLVLAVTLPWRGVLIAALVLAAGLVLRALRAWRQRAR